MNTDVFYAMNDISDKYIIETAACINERSKNDAAAYGKINLFHCAASHNRGRISRIAIIAIVVMTLFTMTGIAYAAVGEKVIEWFYNLFGAQLVTTANRELIGKEVIDHKMPEIIRSGETKTDNAGQNNLNEDHFADNLAECHIIDEFSSDHSILPASISEFEAIKGLTPEIIMTNGGMAVFYQGDYDGWNCKLGDILSFSFERYQSETASAQTLVIGYIRDGIVYEGKTFKELSGCYKLSVREEGKYNLYVINAASDYLTLKQSNIIQNE